jgi:hypothetical protein
LYPDVHLFECHNIEHVTVCRKWVVGCFLIGKFRVRFAACRPVILTYVFCGFRYSENARIVVENMHWLFLSHPYQFIINKNNNAFFIEPK